MADRLALLLRGVNVGGKNKLLMADVVRVMADLGATNVVTYLQSGNIVTTSSDLGLQSALSRAIRERHGLDVAVFRATAADLARIVRDNPFPHKAAEPKKLHVAFLDAPPGTAFAGLGLKHGEDEMALGRREIYLSYSGTSFDSPLVKVLRKAPAPFTTRNWTTVCKLHELTAA